MCFLALFFTLSFSSPKNVQEWQNMALSKATLNINHPRTVSGYKYTYNFGFFYNINGNVVDDSDDTHELYFYNCLFSRCGRIYFHPVDFYTIERSCGFSCNGGGATSTGKFIYAFSEGMMDDQSNLKSLAIVRCDTSMQGTGSVYIEGNQFADVYLQSVNFTSCLVDKYGVLGYFRDWDKAYISHCRYFQCYQNGNGGAGFHFGGTMDDTFSLTFCDFIYCEVGGVDFFSIPSYDEVKVINNCILAYCKWGGVLFWGYNSCFLSVFGTCLNWDDYRVKVSNVFLYQCSGTYGSIDGNVATTGNTNPKANVLTPAIQCDWVDWAFSSEFTVPPTSTITASQKFTLSKVFSLSAKFSSTRKFSTSTLFSNSAYFSPTITPYPTKFHSPTHKFSHSSRFTFSTPLSASSTLTPSFTFTLSKSFVPTQGVSLSGSFTVSSFFSQSRRFPPSSLFSASGLFSDSDLFSSFSYSSTLVPKVNSDNSSSGSSQQLTLWLSIALLLIIVIALALLFFLLWKRRARKDKSRSTDESIQVMLDPCEEDFNEKRVQNPLFNASYLTQSTADPFKDDFESSDGKSSKE